MRKSVLTDLIIRVTERIYTSAMQNHLFSRDWLIRASALLRRLMKSDSSRRRRTLRDTMVNMQSAVTCPLKR